MRPAGRKSSPRILDDGTEVPDDDEFPTPSSSLDRSQPWVGLYSLEQEERGFSIATFDRHGRALRPHPLDAGRYATPRAAFEAIRKWEAGRMAKVRLPEEDVSDDVTEAAVVRSA